MTFAEPSGVDAVCTSNPFNPMADWYVQRPDSELGPLRPAELLDLVRNGTVIEETQVRKDDSSWFAAREVGGLFEAARRPTIEHYCPQCNARVAAPPTSCPKCDAALVNTKKRIIEHSVGRNSSSSSSSFKPSGPAESAKRWLQRKINRKDDP